MPTTTLTSAQARRLLAKFRASSSSQTDFCKRHRVSLSLFSYWLPRLQSPAPVEAPAFREVSIPSASTPSACILTLPGGARLEFPASCLGVALGILSGGKASC
jgi:hypothetical protein